MKSLTIQNFLMLAILFLGLGMLTTSCEQDPCEDVTCLNGGSCEDGDCVCDDRYTGEECEIDKCENVGCNTDNGSYVINGNSCTCECDQGYEGDSCNTEMRAKFINIYSDVDEQCNSGSDQFTMEIKKSSASINKVLITNVYNLFNNPVEATVEGDSLTIPNQEPDNDGFFVEGYGEYIGNSGGTIVTLNYTITDQPNNNSDDCSADLEL